LRNSLQTFGQPTLKQCLTSIPSLFLKDRGKKIAAKIPLKSANIPEISRKYPAIAQ